MELRQLRYFIAVAHGHSFSKAASLLRLSPFELARALDEFEKQVGFQLLHAENNNRIELTARGAAFLAAAESLVAHAGELESWTIDLMTAHDPALLPVSCTASAGIGVASRIVADFRTIHPGAALLATRMSNAAALASLADGTSAAAFVVSPFDAGAAYPVLPVAEEPVVVVLPRTHPLADSSAVSVGQLTAERLVSMSDTTGAGLGEEVLRTFSRTHALPAIARQVPDEATMTEALCDIGGVSLLAESVGKALAREEIVVRPVADRLTVTLALAWNPDDEPEPALADFLAFVRG